MYLKEKEKKKKKKKRVHFKRFVWVQFEGESLK
jgi:hypothetical protein